MMGKVGVKCFHFIKAMNRAVLGGKWDISGQEADKRLRHEGDESRNGIRVLCF